MISAANIAGPPEFLEEWTRAQRDLAGLSTRGGQVTVGGDVSDLLYDAPDAIAEALRQVLAEVRALH